MHHLSRDEGILALRNIINKAVPESDLEPILLETVRHETLEMWAVSYLESLGYNITLP